ncbi:MAG: MetQ/NlpA family ABC transporter substrate-binding protein [Chlamydiia bacterium]
MAKRTTCIAPLLFWCACAIFHGCSSSPPGLKVAASSVPHAELLEAVRPTLEAQGIPLTVIITDDYNTPNRALAEGEVRANFFQHAPFLEAQVKEFHYPLVNFATIELEPMGIYSATLTDLHSMPDGSLVAIPNDPSNEGRALLLLQHQGLLGLRRGSGLFATVNDVSHNPRHLRFVEIDAAMLPRTLQDVSIAVINTNYALEAGLSPTKNALVLEGPDSPYANILVVQSGTENDPQLQALKDALTSDAMRSFIKDRYQGAVIPAF